MSRERHHHDIFDEEGQQVSVDLRRRFLVFAWSTYNAGGGLEDLAGSYDTEADAMARVKALAERDYKRAQVLDKDAGTVVFDTEYIEPLAR